MAKNITTTEQPNLNIIGNGTLINGDIKSNGDVRIDGQVIGNINIQGKLVIGVSGQVKGEVICKNCEISGKLEGKIKISELLSLRSSSKIIGEIKTTKLSIEPGAVFTGSCNMSSENYSANTSPQINNDKK